MKSYTITVNGNVYDVTVEETGSVSAPTAAPVDRDEMPMDDEAPVSSMPDLDEDFGGQRSSSSKIIDIEADDK